MPSLISQKYIGESGEEELGINHFFDKIRKTIVLDNRIERLR